MKTNLEDTIQIKKKKEGGDTVNINLIHLLKDTLDDFIIPLITLLNYRYNKTNDKLTFMPIEEDIKKLQALIPRGKTSDLVGTKWDFRNGKLRQEASSSNSGKEDYF